jgi:hypothetical protein
MDRSKRRRTRAPETDCIFPQTGPAPTTAVYAVGRLNAQCWQWVIWRHPDDVGSCSAHSMPDPIAAGLATTREEGLRAVRAIAPDAPERPNHTAASLAHFVRQRREEQAFIAEYGLQVDATTRVGDIMHMYRQTKAVAEAATGKALPCNVVAMPRALSLLSETELLAIEGMIALIRERRAYPRSGKVIDFASERAKRRVR